MKSEVNRLSGGMSALETRHEMDYRNVLLKLECLNMKGNLYLAPALPHMALLYIMRPRYGVSAWKKPNGILSNPPWIINQ